MPKRFLQFTYLVGALLYAGLVFYWGHHDMGRIHREYRLVSIRLNGDYVALTAGREVAAGCRQTAGGVEGPGYGDCLRASEPLVALRAAALSRELQGEKRQVVKKLVIFYTLLILGLILLPVAAIYVVLGTLLYICSGIRFDKNHSE